MYEDTMKKISSLNIIKETFSLFFGKLSYIIRQTYPQLLIMYGAGFYFIYYSYLIDQGHTESFTALKLISGILLGFFLLLAYINYYIYITQMGVSKKIEPMGLWGFGIGRLQLKFIGTVFVLSLGLFAVIGLGSVISLFISNITPFLGYIGWAAVAIGVIYLTLRVYFLFPALIYTPTLGFVESWNQSKGRLLTISGVFFFLILISIVVSLVISLPDIINVFKGTQPAEPKFSILSLFITITFHLVNLGIGSLAPAILYKRIKG